MRVALLVNSSWNILNYRRSLIKALLSANYEVVALAPFDNNVKQLEELGCSYVPIKNIRRKGKNPIRDVLLIQELITVYKKHKIDLVLNYTIKPNIYGSIAAHLSRIDSICTVTGLGYSFMTNSTINKIVKRLYKLAFRKSKVVVFQNPDDLKLFVTLGLVSKKKTKLIYGSGIDTDKFQANNNLKNSKIINFLFVGRLLFDKGISELISAVKAMAKVNNNIHLHIVGDIDRNNPASLDDNWLQTYGKHELISFYGCQNDVKSFIEMADVVILPSYREGLPRVMLEALSMEKPVITTDVPGCREVIDTQKNGFLVEAKSSTSLAEAMLKMASLSSSQRIQMGKHGRNLALTKFSSTIVDNEYLKLIKSLSTSN